MHPQLGIEAPNNRAIPAQGEQPSSPRAEQQAFGSAFDPMRTAAGAKGRQGLRQGPPEAAHLQPCCRQQRQRHFAFGLLRQVVVDDFANLDRPPVEQHFELGMRAAGALPRSRWIAHLQQPQPLLRIERRVQVAGKEHGLGGRHRGGEAQAAQFLAVRQGEHRDPPVRVHAQGGFAAGIHIQQLGLAGGQGNQGARAYGGRAKERRGHLHQKREHQQDGDGHGGGAKRHDAPGQGVEPAPSSGQGADVQAGRHGSANGSSAAPPRTQLTATECNRPWRRFPVPVGTV